MLLLISPMLLNYIISVQAIPEITDASFDFGVVGSPVLAGYTEIRNTYVFSGATGYGWNETLAGADRGAGSGRDSATQDLNFHNTASIFQIYVGANKGTFNFNFTFADWGYDHIIVVKIEGKELINFSTVIDTVYLKQVSIYCDDGYLDIEFQATGTNWIINSLEIEYITDFYDDFTDLNDWVLYNNATNAIPWVGDGMVNFNTNTTWVSFNDFGGRQQYTDAITTTMPAMYYAGNGADTFSNGTIEFDLITAEYGPPFIIFMPGGRLGALYSNSTTSNSYWTMGDEASRLGTGYNMNLFVTFRMQDDGNYYIFRMTWGGYSNDYAGTEGSGPVNLWNWQFAKCITVDGHPNWSWMTGKALTPPLGANSTYHVMFTAEGDTFRAYIPYAGIDAIMEDTDSTWASGIWGGIGIYLAYSPVSPMRIDNFCYSNTVAYDRSAVGIEYFYDNVLQATDTYVLWYTTEFFWHNIINSTVLTSVRAFMDEYAPATFAYMGYNFAGAHYVGNNTSPIGNRLAVWIMPGGLGGYCSSGHDGYAPSWYSGELPHIGIGVGCFDTTIGLPYISDNLKGYYAYLLLAHEWMNMFNFYSMVNVPNWMADGHSPLAFTSKTYPLRVAGAAMGGTIGGLIIDMADWELYYGSYGTYDSGVRFVDIYNTLYPTAFGETYQLHREQYMAYGWTIYENATGTDPITIDLALRANYIEVYFEHGAGVSSLPWDYITYIPVAHNDVILRRTLSNILFDMRSSVKMIADYQADLGDVTAMNATMETAWEAWRRGYYDTAKTTMAPVYSALIGLGYSTITPLVPSIFNTIVWEYNAATYTGTTPIYGTIWGGQTFTTGPTAHTINEVDLMIADVGTPVILNVEIYAVGINHKPTGLALTSGLISIWTGFDGFWFPAYLTPISLTANTEYAIVCSAWGGGGSGSNYISLNYGTTYSNGGSVLSVNSGSSWTYNANIDAKFYVYGVESPTPTSISITDMDTTNNLYAMYKYYTFVVNGTSSDATDITDVYLTIIKSSITYFEVHGATLSTTPTWHINSGSTLIQLDTTSCTWFASGTSGSATFIIRPMWDFPEASGYDLYSEFATAGSSSGLVLMETAYFDLVSELIGTMNTTTPVIYLNTPLVISGHIGYPDDPGSIVDSGLYPPNSIFTGVFIHDLTNSIVGGDGTIVNGDYAVGFVSPIVLQTYIYHLNVEAHTNFDREPINSPTLGIDVSADMGILMPFLLGILDGVLGWFGVVDGATAISTMISAYVVYFIDSIDVLVKTIDMLGVMVFGFGFFILDWGLRVSEVVLNITAFIVNLLEGTASVSTGLGNIWAFFGNMEGFLDFIPIMVVVWWLMSVDERIKTTGQNMFSIAIGDIQIAWGLLNIVTSTALSVYNMIWGIVMWIFSYRPF